MRQASGLVLPITICCSQTVQQLKQSISHDMHIDVVLLDLVYDREIMLDEDKLWRSQICNGCLIDLLIEESFELAVKSLTGTTHFVPFKPSWTIWRLKWEIHSKAGNPPDQQRLIFNGRQLKDGLLLKDLGVEPGVTLHLVSRLKGD